MTREQREKWKRWFAHCSSAEGGISWAICRLIDQVDALERNREWCAQVLGKELLNEGLDVYARATVNAVRESLRWGPIGG